MPAFDVTAIPPSLTLKPGATATIEVTVSNKLGRSAIARADKAVEPASAAAWFKAPPDAQRTYGTGESNKLSFAVAIPADATPQSIKFRVDVVELGAESDNFGQSSTVAITIPAPEAKPVTPPPPPPPGIPVWVWPVVALVVIGIGVTAWLLLRKKGGGDMPNVVEKSFADAKAALEQMKVVVVRVDKLSAVTDTAKYPPGTVMAQVPAAGDKLKARKDTADTATLTVQKDFTVVPAGIVNGTPVDAASKLGLAGLAAKVGWQEVSAAPAGKDKVLAANPGEGALATRGDTVVITVGWICSPQPCRRVGIDAVGSISLIQGVERANNQKIRDHRTRIPH